MKFLLICYISLIGCGTDICEGNDFVTKQNICVFTNGYTVEKNQIELIVGLTQKQIKQDSRDYNESETKNFDETSLKFIENLKNPKFAGQMNSHVGFFQDDRYKISLEYKKDCLLWFEFIHELIHVHLVSTNGDYSHKKGWFWDSEFTDKENELSIQNIIFKQVACN